MKKIEELLEALEKHKNSLTIVEGKNDKKALESFGFSNILILDKALFAVVEEINSKEVMILTDLDAHGKKLYGYFFRECSLRGITVNNQVRDLLHCSQLRQIEGLRRYVERTNNH